jgi:GntR family transcriptional repressor for pyruvate dehydrogenase complex
MKFRQVKKVRVFEEIVEQLKDYFAKGELKPGDRLPSERDLAAQFNVSRVSVRQALTILETQGLLVRKVGGGTYKVSEEDFEVSQLVNLLTFKKAEINEPLEVRRLIEPKMAQMAAERATQEDIAEMEDCLSRQKARIEAGELIISEDNEFHHAIAKATKNGIIIKLVEAIYDMLWQTRENSIKAEQGSKRSLEGHYPILDAIKKGDSYAAYEAMRKHLEEVESLILSYVEKNTKS